MNHDSPADIRAVLEGRGLALKKRWGQNFLVNRGARARIVDLLAVCPGEAVWEIGPGLGSMTELLLERGARLTAFEVDRGLCRYVDETFARKGSFLLVPGDFMDTWKPVRERAGAPQKVLGNLPYRSASLMIADLVEGELRPRVMIFTVQKELADRMTAQPGQKSFSSFTVLCRSCFFVEQRGELKPGSFYPVPEVASAIVELRPDPAAPAGESLLMLSRLARGLFSSRRKTLRNNAMAFAAASAVSGFGTVPADAVLAALAAEGVDAGRRAEEVAPEVYVAVARSLTGSAAP